MHYILLYLFILYNVGYAEYISKPVIGIEMTQEGFHRDLVYTVQFDNHMTQMGCEYILQQNLPAAVYVSVDQLNDLVRLKKLDAIYPKFVDIEASTENSQAFTVLLRSLPKHSETLQLPIHFRYHAPSADSAFVNVPLDMPQMYLSCLETDNLKQTLKLPFLKSSNKYCLPDDDVHFISADSEQTDDFEDCNWQLANVLIDLKSDLNAQIPVGDSKSYPAVLYVTIVISWIMSLWTIFKTKDAPRRINEQLEKQRQLMKNK